jgi:hypothetical protein
MQANQYRDHLISIIHCLLCHLTFLLTYPYSCILDLFFNTWPKPLYDQSLLVHAKQATYMTIFIPLMSHLPFVKYACFIWCHDIYPTTWKSFHKFYLHCCFSAWTKLFPWYSSTTIYNLAFTWTQCGIPSSLLSSWTLIHLSLYRPQAYAIHSTSCSTFGKLVRPLIVLSLNPPKHTRGPRCTFSASYWSEI